MSTKVHLVKAMVFPVVMYGCVSWTIKKAEHWRINTFGLWCWRRLLRVPCTVRRSNQSILQEISPEHSLERLMLKLKFQYFWPPDAKNWLLGKDPDSWKDWRQEEKGMTEGNMVGWHHWLNGREFEQAPGVGDGEGNLACCSPRGRKESDTTEWLNCYNIDMSYIHICLLSQFSHVWISVMLWIVAHQAPLPMGFSRQEYWSGLPFPPPRGFPNPGMEPLSLMFPAFVFLMTSTTWEACVCVCVCVCVSI